MDIPLHFSALRAHARPAAAPAGWNDALDHRCVRLISAGGEHVGLERMTLGSELLRHGFKEWGGVRQALNVAPAGRDGTLDDTGIAQVRAAIDAADESCELPVVVCRDRLAPARLLESDTLEGRSLLGFVGWPARQHTSLRWPAPLHTPPGVAIEDMAWLGAPETACNGASWRIALPFLVGMRGLSADSVQFYLRALERHQRELQPLRVWLVVFLDRLRLGREGDEFFDDEVLAALLNWMQRQAAEPRLVLLSTEPLSPLLRERVGPAARHLGQALFRPRESSSTRNHP